MFAGRRRRRHHRGFELVAVVQAVGKLGRVRRRRDVRRGVGAGPSRAAAAAARLDERRRDRSEQLCSARRRRDGFGFNRPRASLRRPSHRPGRRVPAPRRRVTGRRRRERIVAREERSNELRETRRLSRARRPGHAGAIRGNEHLRHGLRGRARINRARLGHLIKMSQQRGPRVVPVLRLSIAELLRGEERVGLGQLVVMPREPLLRHEGAVVVVVEESGRSRFAVAFRNRSNQGSHRVARDGAGFPSGAPSSTSAATKTPAMTSSPVSRLAS